MTIAARLASRARTERAPVHQRIRKERDRASRDRPNLTGQPHRTRVHEYVRTQPPEPLLKALLQRDCTGNLPVEREMSADAPWPEEIQAHLSPFSAPPESSHPPLGNWSVMVSPISCPPTMVMPASGPSPLKLAPQLAPASVMYGRLV